MTCQIGNNYIKYEYVNVNCEHIEKSENIFVSLNTFIQI